MPTWLTFFISAFVVLGGLAGLYVTITILVGGLRTKARPRMGIASGDGAGTVNVWVNWDPKEFALQVYRLRFTFIAPESRMKESTFTTTFDNPMVEPFVQTVELSGPFKELLERDAGERAMFTVDFKTVEESTMSKNYTLAKFKRVYQGGKLGRVPAIKNRLAAIQPDVATVFSLDFSELQARKKKLSALEAAAKAKAKTAPPAKPAAAAAPASATPAPASSTPTGSSATKSIRDVVSASNAKQAEKPVEKP